MISSLFSFIRIYPTKSLVYQDSESSEIFYTISTIGWIIGKYCLYFTFVFRLYTSFNNTQFGYNKSVFIALWVMLALQMIFLVFGVISLIFYPDTMVYTAGGFFVFDIIFNLAILVLFTRRVFQIVVMIQETRVLDKVYYYDQDLEDNEDEVDMIVKSTTDMTLNGKQYDLLFTVNKMTVLTVLMIVSAIFLGFTQYIGGEQKNELLIYAHGVAFNLDNFVNGICVALYFGFSNGIYRRLCVVCDKCCLCCCKCIARVKVKRVQSVDIELK